MRKTSWTNVYCCQTGDLDLCECDIVRPASKVLHCQFIKRVPKTWVQYWQ